MKYNFLGTGIFSQPASVLEGTGGSKGAALFLWVMGGIMTLAGYDNGKAKLAAVAHIVKQVAYLSRVWYLTAI